jgi:tetratricopeptide (TPR) repeat protein
MSHWIGTTSPADAGMNDFKECLKNLRDGHADEALQHARRALGIAPKNPFYLSYTGLLAALSEKRFGDGESLCREALGMKHNHAQLYLNLAEVYYQAGRTPEAIQTLGKRAGIRRARFPDSPGAGKDWNAPATSAYVFASQPPDQREARKVAPSVDWTTQSGLVRGAPKL